MARGDGLTPYWRRKALGAAYGEHVCDWRSWRYRVMISAARARYRAERAAWAAEHAKRHVIDAARAGEWVGVVATQGRLCDDGRKPGWVVRVMGDFGDLWIE